MLAPGTWVYVKGVTEPLQVRLQAPSMPTVVNGVRAAYPAFMLSDGTTRPITDLTLAPICSICRQPLRLTETARYVFEMTPQQFAGKIFPSAVEVVHKQCVGQTPVPAPSGQGVPIQAPAPAPLPPGTAIWPPPMAMQAAKNAPAPKPPATPATGSAPADPVPSQAPQAPRVEVVRNGDIGGIVSE